MRGDTATVPAGTVTAPAGERDGRSGGTTAGAGSGGCAAGTSTGTGTVRSPADDDVVRRGTVVVETGPGAVQVGVDPRWSVRITGLLPAEVRWLRHSALRGAPGIRGDCPAEVRVAQLRGALRAAGLLVAPVQTHPDAILAPANGAADVAALAQLADGTTGDAVLAARARRTVAIDGLGRSGMAIAVVLASAGVGRLVLDDPTVVQATDVGLGAYRWQDVGQVRSTAARRVISEVSGVHVSSRVEQDLDAAVLTSAWVADAARADRLMVDRVPHLSVVTGEAGATVGPFVRPGSTPCLRCVELARADEDPAWPVVSRALRSRSRLTATAESTATATAAGIAAAQVLALLDGAEPTTGHACIEVLLPGCVPTGRPVAPWAGCACGAARSTTPRS
ncbi:ThiF family adenylyltransferase [Paraoerskovia sediminicola]|nr:thiamine biosynthesis protein ThiF [Paraoerskovia sediminicola]